MRNQPPTSDVCPPCRFGRFELQPDNRRLLADGEPLVLGARAFDLLVALVGRAGQLVSKNDLLGLVWPGLVVEENNLQVQVSTLRKLLGPNALATIPGRGYRFELPVASALAVAPPPGSAAVAPASANTNTNKEPIAVPPAAPTRAPTNLPTRLASLYGRATDLEAVKSLLERHDVVTIAGAGGIGKTRLAQAVAAQQALDRTADYPDGIWWVELAPLADGALVPSAIARVLNVQLSAERPAVESLVAVLEPQRLLLVLDNCEHLTDAVAAFVDAVAAAAPGVRLLVTSQETLKSTGEHVYRIGALAVPADGADAAGLQAGAVELFVARAQGVDPTFVLTPANAPAVVEICRRLDGIPLAIELAAARLPLLGVEGLRTRLHERFNVLTAGARVVLRRHQTLRATLEWSHGLLSAEEQTVFRRLGVFAGSFTLEAAQHVVHDGQIDTWAALDHLGALVDKSLVLAEGDPVPRYCLLETTRMFALERLAEAGQTQATLRRHAEAVLEFLRDLESDDKRWNTKPAVQSAAAAELDNLRAAQRWASATSAGHDLAIPLAGLSARVWLGTVQLAEGLGYCLALRRHLRADTPLPVAAQFWMTVARLGQYSTRSECYAAAFAAADLYRKLGDDSRLYDALICGAAQGIRFATTEEMGLAIAEATRLERPEWPARQRGTLEFARLRWFMRQDRFDDALASAHRQAALYRESDERRAEYFATSNIAAAELALGRTEDSLRHARAAIAALEDLGEEAGAGHLYWCVMTCELLEGRVDAALAAGRKAHALLLSECDEFRVLLPLALCVAMRGRAAAAARICGFADAEASRTGVRAEWSVSRVRERLDEMLGQALRPDELGHLLAQGATMRRDDAFALGLGSSN